MTPTRSNNAVDKTTDTPSADPIPVPRDENAPEMVADDPGKKQDNAVRSDLYKMQVLQQLGGNRLADRVTDKTPKKDKNEKEGGLPEGIKHAVETGKPAIEGTKTTKEGYEATGGVIDLSKGARTVMDAKVESVEKDIESLKTISGSVINSSARELASIQAQTQAIVQAVANGKMSPADARKALAPLLEQQKKVLGQISKCEDLLKQIEKEEPLVKGLGTIGKDIEQVEKAMGDLKQCKGNLGKALFGLDAACNFADLEERDPANPGKNATEAVSMSAAKFLSDLGTAGTKMNAAETAVGVMKFGMKMLGMSDTPEGKALDVVASGMPMDVFTKNVGMLTDMTVTIGKDIWSGGGNLKDWERINNDNLTGKNGPVAAAAAMIGDMLATGGRNIPTQDMYNLGNTLGVFGKGENMPDQLKRSNTPAKVRMINDLLDDNAGAVTTGAAGQNTLKAREMLTYGPPGQTVDVLKQLDKHKLVDNLVGPQQGSPFNQLTGTMVDLIHKANAPLTSPQTRMDLMGQVGQMVNACVPKHTQAINQMYDLMMNNKLGDIPLNLRNLIMDAHRDLQRS
jgi:hypothetical protein